MTTPTTKPKASKGRIRLRRPAAGGRPALWEAQTTAGRSGFGAMATMVGTVKGKLSGN